MPTQVLSAELEATVAAEEERRGVDPAPAVLEAPAIVAPAPVMRMARKADLMDAVDLEPLDLKHGQVTVMVRALDAPLFSELIEVPDLLGYREVQVEIARVRAELAKAGDEAGAADDDAIEAQASPIVTGRFIREQLTYFAAIAHLAIADTDADQEEVECSCGMRHAPSLWSIAQCRRMHPRDTEDVATFALRGIRLGRLGPTSEVPQDSPTPSSAEPGT